MASRFITISRKDPRFNTLKKGNNLRFPATDAEAANRIIVCSNEAEIADALQRVVSSGMRPTVRSGGHCYEDFVSNNPNGAILDVSLHNRVDAGPAGSPIRVAAGVRLGDLYQTLFKGYNATLPAGTCYTVGAGGHISGGGYGLMSRLHGLTVDWITGLDILTVDSKGNVVKRRIDKLNDPDLFRACRGAGSGNFGIITNFYFDKLPAAPAEIAEASLSFPWSSLTEEAFCKLLTIYGDYWAGRGKDPEAAALSVVMVLGPSSHPNSHISMHAQYCNAHGAATDLELVREFFDRFAEWQPAQNAGQNPAESNSYAIARRPWLDATLEDSDPGGPVRAKYKSTYMKVNFSKEECQTLYHNLTSRQIDSSGFVLAIDGYGGTINRPARIDDTAIAQRSSIMKLQWQCYWQEKSQDDGRLKFMDEFYTAMYTGPHVPAEYQGTPFGPRYEGCYMNYPDADMLRYRYWPQLYYGTGDLYPFLQQVKRRYDPNNIFHSSMSVRP